MDQGQRIAPQRDWAKVQNWMLPALIIVLLLTGLDTIVYYADQRDRSAQVLSSTLPADYQRTIMSLVSSTGHVCERVCSLTPLAAAPGTTSVLVKCGSSADGATCRQTTSYNLNVEPTAQPSR
jgi:hypothetical protein